MSMQVRGYILALKTRADVTRGPNRGISGPTKRTNVLQFFKKIMKSRSWRKSPGNISDCLSSHGCHLIVCSRKTSANILLV